MFVRVRALFVRCSYAVRVVVRTLFVRCSYERELTRELRDAPVWRGQFSMHSRRDFENDFCLIRFNFVIAPCFSPKRSRIFQQKTTDAHIERPHGRPQPTGCPQWCTSHTGLTATGFPATGHSADHTHTCHYHQHQPRWARWARWKSMEYIVVMVAGLASCGAYLVACGRVASWFLALGPFLGFFSF